MVLTIAQSIRQRISSRYRSELLDMWKGFNILSLTDKTPLQNKTKLTGIDLTWIHTIGWWPLLSLFTYPQRPVPGWSPVKNLRLLSRPSLDRWHLIHFYSFITKTGTRQCWMNLSGNKRISIESSVIPRVWNLSPVYSNIGWIH